MHVTNHVAVALSRAYVEVSECRADGFWIWCPADRFGVHTPNAWKRNVDTTWVFFLFWKLSRTVLLILQSINDFFCWVLRSHGNRQPALYEFWMYWWFKEWYSTAPRYRFVLTPGTLAKLISRKNRVQLADLPKVRFSRSVFSAPRQRMSVVEGREVIFYYIKKIRRVIFELSIISLLHWASQQKSVRKVVRTLSGHCPVTEPRRIHTGLSFEITRSHPLRLFFASSPAF